MDVKAIREVRRALETIIAYDTEYKCDLITHEPDYDHPIDGSCGLIARRALGALSAIDPEAIRAEARTEYRVELDAYIRTLRNFRDNWDCDEDAHAHGTTCRACEAADVLGHFARGAILADEPKAEKEE